MRKGFRAVILTCLSLARANPQSGDEVHPPAATGSAQLSPRAAYKAAMEPVEITRGPIENWSGIEQASFAVAVRQAADACAVRPAAGFTGDDLVDLSRLCALGLAWPSVIDATGRYLQPG